jgi:hypothetical protein
MLTKSTECVLQNKYKVSFDEIEMEPFTKINDISKTYERMENKKTFLRDVKEFCRNTTFHGIKYVIESGSVYRR